MHIDFRERGREGEREKHWLAASCTWPDREPNLLELQPRYVPWLGIEPMTSRFTGQRSNRATPARTTSLNFFSNFGITSYAGHFLQGTVHTFLPCLTCLLFLFNSYSCFPEGRGCVSAAVHLWCPAQCFAYSKCSICVSLSEWITFIFLFYVRAWHFEWCAKIRVSWLGASIILTGTIPKPGWVV